MDTFQHLKLVAGTDVKMFQDHCLQVIMSVFLKLMRNVAFSFRAELRIEKLHNWSNYFVSSTNLLVLRGLLCFSLLSSV